MTAGGAAEVDPGPRYVRLHRRGELTRRARLARAALRECHVCPRRCGADRARGETGFCGLDNGLRVSHHLPHFGEEPPISGTGGAGTIFFSSCNLRCLGCQNFQISQQGHGRTETARDLAGRMLDLQDRGCHNVELVSASHVLPQVLESLDLAVSDGLRLPIVYNSNGYESSEGLAWLDGVVDVYLPDAKFSEDTVAGEISDCRDYVPVNRTALREMHRQVGDLAVDEKGNATRGLIVRVLVLPDDAAGCLGTLEWIAENLGTSVWLSIMSQYSPYYRAAGHPRIGRPVSPQEYEAVLSWAERLGFDNYFHQELGSQEACVPDFARDEPFDFGIRAR